jgi:phosphatidate cytidylyltransferase
MSNLTKRILTAAVLIPVLVVALFIDPTIWSALAIVALAGCIGIDEYLRMALPVTPDDRGWSLRVAAWLGAASIISLVTLYGPERALAPSLIGSAVLICVALLMRKSALAEAGRHFGVGVSGLVYVPVFLSALILLKADLGEQGGAWLYLTLAIAFASDTMAYTFGRLFGRHKLYPAVSPKKTWEGSFGGLVGGSAATLGFGTYWLIPELSVMHAVILGVAGSVVGQIGDLVESMIKRTYDVKDSGNVLPGHGGMLDRIDALLFVAPLVYYYTKLVL